MRYTLSNPGTTTDVMVVGCGGTGGFVAEGLCRLFTGKPNEIVLVDPDRVEEKNLIRQNFYREDLGMFKSAVLAERLSKQFNRSITFYTGSIEELALNERRHLTIGCVDNPDARERLMRAGYMTMGNIATYCDWNGWYIDAGNSEYAGQVLIGNAFYKRCRKSFYPLFGRVERLPLPQVQEPALLAPETHPRNDCARAVEREEQSPVINRMMADLVLTFVHKLLNSSLTWMAAYIDLEAGTMRAVDAEPEAVSRITGDSVKQLEYRPRWARA